MTWHREELYTSVIPIIDHRLIMFKRRVISKHHLMSPRRREHPHHDDDHNGTISIVASCYSPAGPMLCCPYTCISILHPAPASPDMREAQQRVLPLACTSPTVHAAGESLAARPRLAESLVSDQASHSVDLHWLGPSTPSFFSRNSKLINSFNALIFFVFIRFCPLKIFFFFYKSWYLIEFCRLTD